MDGAGAEQGLADKFRMDGGGGVEVAGIFRGVAPGEDLATLRDFHGGKRCGSLRWCGWMRRGA
jgi:hypothetical protein